MEEPNLIRSEQTIVSELLLGDAKVSIFTDGDLVSVEIADRRDHEHGTTVFYGSIREELAKIQPLVRQ